MTEPIADLDAAPIKAGALKTDLDNTFAAIMKPVDGKPWRVEIIRNDDTHEVVAVVPVHERDIPTLEKALAAAEVELHPSLKNYKQGEFVEVQKDGRWVAGKVTGIEKGSSILLYVDSERGPRTVASTHVIRKVVTA